MHWTKWPYWLIGGVIGMAIPIICLLLMVSCGYTTTSWACFSFLLPLLPFYILGETEAFGTFFSLNFYILLGIIAWLIVGLLLGTLVKWVQINKPGGWTF
jgi:hypothetical protein